jgi:hypothetical protein
MNASSYLGTSCRSPRFPEQAGPLSGNQGAAFGASLFCISRSFYSEKTIVWQSQRQQGWPTPELTYLDYTLEL